MVFEKKKEDKSIHLSYGICSKCKKSNKYRLSVINNDESMVCEGKNFYLSKYNDKTVKEFRYMYEKRKKESKCRFFIEKTVNKTVNKRGIKEVNITEETEKVRNSIKELKKQRRTRIDESNIRYILHDVAMTNGYKFKFERDFIKYMKQEVDKKTFKSVKKFSIKKYEWETHLIELKREVWLEFLKILTLIEQYYDKYILYENKKILCYYTDCYKELATEKTCSQCKSTNLIEAKFCNQCGNEL